VSALPFARFREGSLEFLLRTDLQGELLPALRAAPHGWEGYQVERLPGGRGASVSLFLGRNHYVARAGRRGGLPGRVLDSVYFGFSPRPMREALASEALRTRGAPVVEVCAAAVQWIVPGIYRSWLLTRWIDGAQTLLEWAAFERRSAVRQLGFAATGRALARLHAAGARHPDLNVSNILVVANGDDVEVVLIDLDRVWLQAVSARAGAADLARLRRSIDKRDPTRQVITTTDFEAIVGAHARHAASQSSLSE